MQACQTALASLEAARQAHESAAQVYASEQRKLRNGASTTFLVLQRQVEFVGAQGLELQAQTALNKAVAELQRVDGSILAVNHAQFEKLVALIAAHKPPEENDCNVIPRLRSHRPHYGPSSLLTR